MRAIQNKSLLQQLLNDVLSRDLQLDVQASNLRPGPPARLVNPSVLRVVA